MSPLRGFAPILKRDYWGLKGNALLLLVILIAPISLGLAFGTIKNAIPKSAPSAVFPEFGASAEDLRAAQAMASLFSKSSIEEQMDEDKLFREEYYFLVGVPAGFKNESNDINIYMDSSMSPVSELSPYVHDMILYGLSKWYGWEPKINIVEVGRSVLPFQYLAPGIVLLLSVAMGLIVVPFALSQDKEVLARVLPAVPVRSFVLGKLLFASILAFAELAVLLATQEIAGASGSLFFFNPWFLLVLLLSSIFFTSIGISIMLLTGFGEAGKQVNAGLLALVVMFSGALYPVGFFPLLPALGDVLQTIGRSNPAYFFVILMRGFGLRGLGPGVFLDYLVLALIFTAASVFCFAYLTWRMKKNG
ncbi:MAG: hypothetical protein ABIF01_04120 [Candidatus Micrarchaeota archaeon]